LKAEKQKGVTNKDLHANHYQHLLEESLTAGVADMNNYCPVNSSTQVAGQVPSQAYLFCLHNLQICKASGRSASLWRPSIQVIGHSWHQDIKQMFIGQQNFLVTPIVLRI